MKQLLSLLIYFLFMVKLILQLPPALLLLPPQGTTTSQFQYSYVYHSSSLP